jgi:heterodisulfide reductase subunit C
VENPHGSEERDVSENSESFEKKELYRCLQCAVCTGSCPVAPVIDGFNPREMILQYAFHGEKDRAWKDGLVWCCSTCYACNERCPHGIDVCGLLTHIMNRAAANGELPGNLREGLKILLDTGRLLRTTPRSERIRSEIGLAPLSTSSSPEIRQLLVAAGLDRLLEAE